MPHIAAVVILVLALSACAHPTGEFSVANARAHVQMLAGSIGSRPVGTAANARARAYLVDQLERAGFDVRVQEAEGQRTELGLTGRVANIIALRPGARSEAIALVAHYDSRDDTPGAADDAFGTAVSVEAARVLAERPQPNYSLKVLLTDGEEAGLLGAAALLAGRELDGILAYLNLEAIGSSGPVMLFETGPGHHWLVDVWARHAPRPAGGSYAYEIYRRLPSDTDFSILKQAGMPGLNFAAIGDSYAYHTSLDSPDRLSDVAMRDLGTNVVAIVGALDHMDLARPSGGGSVYFDLGRAIGISYGPGAAQLVTLAALLAGVVAWIRVAGSAISRIGPVRLLLSAVWALIAVVAATAAMSGAAGLLRGAREVYHPWYAHPDRFFIWLAITAVTALWLVSRLERRSPGALRAATDPAVLWTMTLPVWVGLAAWAAWYVPGASYLWTLPLLAAGVALSVLPPASLPASRVAAALALAVAAPVWLPDAAELLRFFVATFGRQPVITPVPVYPIVILGIAAMIVPPVIGLLLGARPLVRPAAFTFFCLVAFAAGAALAYAAPAYTPERPLRRAVRYVHDLVQDRTAWELLGNEPGLDLGPGAPSVWQSSGPAASRQISPPPRFPFAFHADGPTDVAPPAAVTAHLQRRGPWWDLRVTVRPLEEGLTVTFALPSGVEPLRSNLPGVTRPPYGWRAEYVAPPAEGLTLEAAFDEPPALDGAAVVLRSARLPQSVRGRRLPPWLPEERTVWQQDAIFVLPLAPEPTAATAP